MTGCHTSDFLSRVCPLLKVLFDAQGGPGNGNERALHTDQISKTGALSSDAVKCYTENIASKWLQGSAKNT